MTEPHDTQRGGISSSRHGYLYYESPVAVPSDTPRLMIIMYNFPPDPAVGGLRWEQMSRHFAQEGWAVDVVTRDFSDVAGLDRSRLNGLPAGTRIYSVPSQEPLLVRIQKVLWPSVRRMLGERRAPGATALSQSEISEQQGARVLVRSYVAWMDVKRDNGWARAAARVATSLAGSGNYLAVISSGPPHMAHEAARLTAKRTGLPFVVDMRDPWSLVQRVTEVVASPVWLFLARRFERRAVDAASLITMNTEQSCRAMRDAYPERAGKIEVIRNGCDDEPLPPTVRDGCFRLRFAGTIYMDRDPRLVFRAARAIISKLGLTPDQFLIEFIGNADHYEGKATVDIAGEEGVGDFVRVSGRVPRQKSLEFLANATMLLSLPQDSHFAVPAKIYEYVRFDAWLLVSASPHSATAQLVKDTDADVVDHGDVDAIARVLEHRYLQFVSGDLPGAIARDGRFDRRVQSKKLIALLNERCGAVAGVRDASLAAAGRAPRANFRLSNDDLVIVDLSGTEVNRKLVRWLANAVVRRTAARRRGKGKLSLLVFAPFGDANTIDTPQHVERFSASSLIGLPERDAVNEWAFETANELISGAGRDLFPRIRGVHLGDLNLLAVQGYIQDYAMLVAAIRAYGRNQTVRRCIVISGYADIGSAIAREAKGVATSVRALHPPRELHMEFTLLARRFRRDPPPLTEALPVDQEHPRVLMVSDSVPMRMMFAAIEPHLAAAGAGPTLRLDYRPATETARPAAEPRVVTRRIPSAAACPEASRDQIGQHRISTRQLLAARGDAQPSAALRRVMASLPMDHFLSGLSLSQFAEQAAHLEEVEWLLRELRPQLVVVGNDRWWLGQSFVREAQRLGIPTLALQDGIEGAHPNWFWAAADVIGTSGEIYPEYLLAHGVDAGRIHTVGQPRYDSFLKRNKGEDSVGARRSTRKQLGLESDAFYVLFAAQPTQDRAYAQQVMEAVLAVPGVRLIVRPHPSSDVAPYAQLVSMLGDHRATLQTSGGTQDVLNACDVVVLQHSTVALEAVILDRFVISANFSGVPDVTPYVELGISLPATTSAELTATIAQLVALPASERAASKAQAKRALERLLGPQDGQAGQRAANLISSLLGGVLAADTQKAGA